MLTVADVEVVVKLIGITMTETMLIAFWAPVHRLPHLPHELGLRFIAGSC
jgi:hypothetical protein